MKTRLKEFSKIVFKKAGVGLLAFVLAHTAVANTVTYYHNDISGTPLVSTDAVGNVIWKENYKPYGDKLNPPKPSDSNGIGFHGRPHDDFTGLSYMGARYYDPSLGRLMGVDPVEFQEDNLHSFNRYAYANNNPYKYVDPDGKYAFLIAPLMYALTALAGAATVNSVMQEGFRERRSSFSADGISYPGKNIDTFSVWRPGSVHNEAKERDDDKDVGVIPDEPAGTVKIPTERWWKGQGIDPHDEKEGLGGSKRNLGIDKKDNVWTVDRQGSGNPSYLGRLKDMREDK